MNIRNDDWPVGASCRTDPRAFEATIGDLRPRHAVARRNGAFCGPDSGAFLLRRNGPTTRPLTVWYGIEPTGASNGVDYELIASIATFPAGEATLTVIILPFDDSDIEGREDVVLSLVQDAGYLVGAANTGLVRNGDNPFLFVTVTATDDAFEAGPVPGAFNVNPSGPLTHASKSSTRSRAPP